MNRSLSALLLATALASAACVVESHPPANPCEPNPCRDANRTQCAVEDNQARCLCDLGFIARPNGTCEPVSQANCAEHAGDSAEPDDCTARARALLPDGRARLQTIDPIGDYDFFQFDGTARGIYVFTAKPEGSPVLPRVDVYDSDGKWLAAAESSGQTELAFKARVTARYYARVSHSPVDPSVATGRYALTFVSQGAEDHGDSSSEATPLTSDPFDTATPRDYYGRFELAGDEDWFSFPAQSGAYRLSFDPSRVVPQVAVFAGGNFQQPVFTAWNATVDFTVPLGTTGTVYVALAPARGPGSYAFRFFH